MRDLDPTLERLADLYGVELSYWDAQGEEKHADPDALLALLGGLDPRVQRREDVADVLLAVERARAARMLPPVAVAWDGNGDVPVQLPPSTKDDQVELIVELERGTRRTDVARLRPGSQTRAVSGGTRRVGLVRVEGLPPGYHELVLRRNAGVDVNRVEAHVAQCRIISAPTRAFEGAPTADPRRDWGVFLPLYALHRDRGGAIGDLGALRALTRWVHGLGGSVVGTLPLLASFLDEPFQPSPYAPVSRLFWNELYLELPEIPEWGACEAARRAVDSTQTRAEEAALRDSPWVDYRAVHGLRSRGLRALSDWFFTHGAPARRLAFERHLDTHPELDDYAQFRAAMARGGVWGCWSPAAQEGRLAEGDWDRADWQYHAFAQWNAHLQLEALSKSARGRGLGLYLDLPLGVHPDGYDAWRHRHLFCGLATGAPPDALFSGGQNWGFPPLHPDAILDDGLEYVAAVIRNHLRYAGVLRLDHVMGLHRLYCIPEGFAATEGIYVRQPAEGLYAVLTLESARAQARLIGEDLGTVPDDVRAGMAAHGVRRMHVQQFGMREDPTAPLEAPPAAAVASLNTHDTPTFAGWWNGADIEDQRDLDLVSDEQAQAAQAARTRIEGVLGDWLQNNGWATDGERSAVAVGVLEWLAAGPAELLLVNLEDLWGEVRPQNTPGTTSEQRPNWVGRARYSLEEMQALPEVTDTLAAIARRRERT